jgi:hypothetical protein
MRCGVRDYRFHVFAVSGSRFSRSFSCSFRMPGSAIRGNVLQPAAAAKNHPTFCWGPPASLYFLCRYGAPLVPRVALARSIKERILSFLKGGNCAVGHRRRRKGQVPISSSVLTSLAALGYACVGRFPSISTPSIPYTINTINTFFPQVRLSIHKTHIRLNNISDHAVPFQHRSFHNVSTQHHLQAALHRIKLTTLRTASSTPAKTANARIRQARARNGTTTLGIAASWAAGTTTARPQIAPHT